MTKTGLLGKEDKRTVPRRHLVFYLRIFDGMSSNVLGHLVDISSRGVMLVSDAPIQENQDYRLRMRLPREINGRSEIMLEATSRWCKADSNPDFFITGFQIRRLDQEFAGYIQHLIEDFSIEEAKLNNGTDPPACNLTVTRA